MSKMEGVDKKELDYTTWISEIRKCIQTMDEIRERNNEHKIDGFGESADKIRELTKGMAWEDCGDQGQMMKLPESDEFLIYNYTGDDSEYDYSPIYDKEYFRIISKKEAIELFESAVESMNQKKERLQKEVEKINDLAQRMKERIQELK